MTVAVVTPPGAIVDAPTARARLGLDASVDDATLSALIAAAQATVDGPNGTLGRAIGVQTLELRQPAWGTYRDHWAWWGGHAELGPVPNYVWDFERVHPNWRMWCDRGAIVLPYGPLQSVVSVTYLDPTGTPQTLDPAAYQAFDIGVGIEGRVEPLYGAVWPAFQCRRDAIKVRYTAGFPTPPAPIVQAVLMMARNMASLGTRDSSLRSESTVGIGSASYDTAASGGAGAAVIEALLAPYRALSL